MSWAVYEDTANNDKRRGECDSIKEIGPITQT